MTKPFARLAYHFGVPGCLLLTLATLIASPLQGQNLHNDSVPPPRSLKQLFTYDFSRDTRAGFEIKGRCDWAPGRIVPGKRTTLRKAISGCDWFTIELDLNDPRDSHELQLILELDGETDCLAKVQMVRLSGKETTHVSLNEILVQDEEPAERVVREFQLNHAVGRNLHLEFRVGMVRLSTGTDESVAAYFKTGRSRVVAVTVKAGNHPITINRMTCNADTFSQTALTPEQKSELQNVVSKNRKVAALYRQGQPAEAIAVNNEILETQATILGKQHPDYATSLGNLATLYHSVGELRQAKQCLSEAAQTTRAILGDQHPRYAGSLNNLAMLHLALNEPGQATSLLSKAMDIRREVYGTQSQEYAQSLNNLGGIYDSLGEYSAAEQHFENARQIRRRLLGPTHPDYLNSLNNLIDVFEKTARYSLAEKVLQECLTKRKTVLGENHPDYATSLTKLARLQERRCDFAQAESTLHQVVRIRESVAANTVDHASSLNDLAGHYMSTGDYTEAEKHFTHAKKIIHEQLGTAHPTYAVSIQNLALLHGQTENFAKAVELFDTALDVWERVPDERRGADHALCLCNLGSIYEKTGDYDEALTLTNRAKQLLRGSFGEEHPLYAICLNNLAGLYKRLGDTEQALAYYEDAVNVMKETYSSDHPQYATCLGNLALVHLARGDFARAKQCCQNAMELRKNVLGTRHPMFASSYNSLGGIHEQAGEHEAALHCYQKAADIHAGTLGENNDSYISFIYNIAQVHERRGEFEEATQLHLKALRIAGNMLQQNSVVQSARQQYLHQSELRVHFDGRLSNALHIGLAAEDVLRDVWKWKGAVTLRQQAYHRVANNPEIASLFTELQDVSRILSALSARQPVSPPDTAKNSAFLKHEREMSNWRTRFNQTSASRETLEKKIATASRNFRKMRQPLTVSDVQNSLPAGTAFIDYLEYVHTGVDGPDERRFVAFVVQHGDSPDMIPIGPAAEISAQVQTFRRSFKPGEADQQSLNAVGNRLRESLWAPIEKHLEGINTVIISPDTILGTLPFAVLPGSRPETYLIEDFRIATIPMATQLAECDYMENDTQPPERDSLLIIGDVDYNAQITSETAHVDANVVVHGPGMQILNGLRSSEQFTFRPLPGFRAELRDVNRLFEKRFGNGPATILSGEEATEANFMTRARNAHYVHIVTHGYFASPTVQAISQCEAASPLDASAAVRLRNTGKAYLPGLLSGLAMAGSNCLPPDKRSADDGILRATEIESASFEGVNLVVLSACETGLGAVAGGEGLTGLQRAFHIAGARSVIASLWKVDDRATQELMKQFYTNLWIKKMSKIDALREAQLWMLRHPQELEGMGVEGAAPRGQPRKLADKATTTATSKGRTDPYFWAAFQLSGDWR